MVECVFRKHLGSNGRHDVDMVVANDPQVGGQLHHNKSIGPTNKRRGDFVDRLVAIHRSDARNFSLRTFGR